MAKLLTKDEGLAFRREEQALFDRGIQLATDRYANKSDLRPLISAMEQHFRMPADPSQMTRSDKALILKSQGELRQLIAGYVTGCERQAQEFFGASDVISAFKVMLDRKLNAINDELGKLNSGIINDKSLTSVVSREIRVKEIESEARTVIGREMPKLRRGTLFDNAVSRALETDERWARKYADAKRWLEAGKDAAKTLGLKADAFIGSLTELEALKDFLQNKNIIL